MEDSKYKSTSLVPNPWSRYSSFLTVLLTALLIAALLTFKAEAEVAIFHSDTYLEQGVELVDESGVRKHIQYEHLWSNFKGVVPEEVFVNNIALRFTWSSVTRTVLNQREEDVPIDIVPEVFSAHASSSLPLTEELVEEPASEEILPEFESETPEEADPPPVSIPSVNEEINTTESVLDLVPEQSASSSSTEGFDQVSRSQLFPFVDAQIEEGIATDTESTFSEPEDTGSDVMYAESISTTSGFVSSDIVVENLDERFFEVRYTTDGVTWHVLGTVGFDESHDTVFDLSQVGLEALPNLQIAIRYTVPDGDQTKIIFDSMRIEVGYGVPVIEETIEPIGVNDREPNFEVSSIKSDVQSENIRAVVLERGGAFEFWYSITERGSGIVTWNRLVGGGAIDSEAPIGIKERVIFWLDRNQQTLFGFSVDEKSLFAAPFQNPEEKVFLLLFQNKNSETWEAVFDPESNSLKFHKVPNESL